MPTDLRVAKPSWLRAKVPGGERFSNLRDLVRSERLHTVCEEARCPNIGEGHFYDSW